MELKNLAKLFKFICSSQLTVPSSKLQSNPLVLDEHFFERVLTYPV